MHEDQRRRASRPASDVSQAGTTGCGTRLPSSALSVTFVGTTIIADREVRAERRIDHVLALAPTLAGVGSSATAPMPIGRFASALRTAICLPTRAAPARSRCRRPVVICWPACRRPPAPPRCAGDRCRRYSCSSRTSCRPSRAPHAVASSMMPSVVVSCTGVALWPPVTLQRVVPRRLVVIALLIGDRKHDASFAHWNVVEVVEQPIVSGGCQTSLRLAGREIANHQRERVARPASWPR